MNHRFCVTLLIFLLAFSFYGLTCSADTPTQGTNTVTEVVSGRNQNTRVWQTTNIENAVDLVTGLPTGTQNTTYPLYYEKADGLNYLSSGTTWLPTVEQITISSDINYLYQALQDPYQIKFTGSISASFPVTYTANGDILRMGLRSIGFYNMQTNTLQTLQVVSPSYPVLKGNTLTYPGVFPGIDVQYQYLRGSFEQKLILQNNSSLPSPSIFNMDTTVYLVSITEIDTSSVSCSITNSAGQSLTNGFLSGENQSLYFTDSSTGNTICQFIVSQAFDSQNNDFPLNMYKQIYQADGHLYLLEGVPYSWVQSSQYPITLDYQTLSGSQTGNEVWKSENTYYLSGPYTVGSPWSLAIEGGTVIKFSKGALIIVPSNSKIIAKGDKFSFIMFTSTNDSTVGVATPTWASAPAPGDYTTAIYLEPSSSTTSWIEYCKIAYAMNGLKIQTQLNNPVENNIIRLCSAADVWVSNGVSNGVTLLNNLILGQAGYGIYGYNTTTTAYINALNNTVDGFTTGIYAYATTGPGPYLSCKNNLITNGAFGLYAGNSTFFGTHWYNKFYDVATPWFGVIQTTGENIIAISSTGGPLYSSSPNGSYYLNQSYNVNRSSSGSFSGDSSASVYGLDTKTTETATLILSNITNSTTWSLVPRDTGTGDDVVNIGYHYDPVDVIIGNSSTNDQIYISGTVNISTGAVISFFRSDTTTNAELYVTNGGGILLSAASTTNAALVEFTSIYATGSLHAMPLRGGLDSQDYYCGIFRESGSNPESSIQYARFQYAYAGVLSLDTQNIDQPIQNNVFQSNQYGVYFNGFSGNVVNNLFINDSVGIVCKNNTNPRQVHYLQSNTFYGNQTGVLIVNLSASTCTTVVRLENNIFEGNGAGAWGLNNSTCSWISIETRNNVYYDNNTNVDGTYVSVNTTGGDNADITGSNPMLVHQTQLSSTTFLSSTTHDGFYLAQNSGDASRFPLQISSVSGMSFSFASTPPSGVKITVSSYTNGLSGSVQLGYATTLNGGGWSYTSTGSGLGNILITLNAGANGWTISSTDSIILMFGSDSIRVYLLKVSVYEGQVRYWAALDGSIYYSTPGPTGLYEDAWYAMEYDSSGLAHSAYSAGGRSAAVDKGSVKVTTINSTTYRYTTMASLGSTNTNGTADNSSTYRIIPATLSTSTIDPIGRLDIGYHYNGNVVYTTDVFGNISTVYSGETVLMTESNTNFIGNDVVSGAWNSNTLVDQSMVLYGNGCHTSSLYLGGCGYHVLNTPINNQLVTVNGIESEPFPGIASLAVSPFDNTIVGGVVYSDLTNHLRIYKYLSDTSGWTLLGLLDIASTYPSYIADLSLSVGQDSDVWVTWDWNVQNANTLYATRVSLSASSANLNANSNLLISNWNGAAIEGGHAISMSYDPQSIDTTSGQYGIRLVFLDDTTGGSNPQLRSSPLQINSQGQVALVYSSPLGKLVTESGGTASSNARIVYNPWSTNTVPAYQDFAGAYDGYVRAYDLVTASYPYETWGVDSNFGPKGISIGSAQMDLTYEVTGSKFVTWATSNTLTSNRGNIATFFKTASLAGYPRITTNTRNQRDLLVSWTDGYDLDNSGSAEQALFVQELYP